MRTPDVTFATPWCLLRTAATALAALAVLLGTPVAGLAQVTPDPSARFSGVAAATLYPAAGSICCVHPLLPQAQERKSPFVAAGLELVLPILGNGYAGNAKRGILPAILRVGGVVTVAAAADETGFIPEEKSTQAWIGLAAGVGGTVWGIVSAVRTANAHNRSLSSGNASLSLHPTPHGGLAAGIALRF